MKPISQEMLKDSLEDIIREVNSLVSLAENPPCEDSAVLIANESLQFIYFLEKTIEDAKKKDLKSYCGEMYIQLADFLEVIREEMLPAKNAVENYDENERNGEEYEAHIRSMQSTARYI
jgi:hypothetical protein